VGLSSFIKPYFMRVSLIYSLSNVIIIYNKVVYDCRYLS